MKKLLSVSFILVISIVLILSCKKNKIPALALVDQSFSIYEFSYKGKRVGKINAGVYDTRDLIYKFLKGNTDNTFTVNDTTGEIFVNKTENLIYESIHKFELKVQVNDEYGDENMAIITIDIKDIAPSENIIAYYSFNGNANDLTGNNNHGEVHGAVLTNDQFGNENSAYYFNGINSFLTIDPISNVSEIEDFTFSVRVFCESWNEQPEFYGEMILNEQYIFDGLSNSEILPIDPFTDGFSIYYSLWEENIEYIEFQTLESGSGMGGNFNYENLINNWNHIVYSKEGNKLSYYVNGSLIASHPWIYATLDMQHKWFIGTRAGNNPYYVEVNHSFHGIIDEIKIFNIAIDSDLVKEL